MRRFFCIICDAPNFRPEHLCLFCESKVNARPTPYFLRFERDVPHYYLFKWTPKTDGFCRRLAYFLKNRRSEDFLKWALMFSPQMAPVGIRQAFVPKCSSEKGVNHAKEFALSLKKLLGFKCVLEVGAFLGPQKQRTRGERAEAFKRSVFKKRKVRKLDCSWVFVDDVFVTGGTYKRVGSEFKEAPEMIVTLFYRPLVGRDDDVL
ncbi:MAG: hypothetical protein ACRBBP_01240 [Bdellovibrionales bacterium]